jgi:hypothetical protein
MSLIKTKRTEPAREYEHTEATCDFCGKKSTQAGWSELEWGTGYDWIKTAVRLEVGDKYPEGSSWVTTEFHVCPECFKGKVMPWFESHGVKPTHEGHGT